MKNKSIFLATLLSLSTMIPSITQAKDAEDKTIVKYDIEFGTVGELKTQVAAMYELVNITVNDLARQGAIDSKTERERDLNNCIEVMTNAINLSAFEHVAIQSEPFVQDKIRDLSMNDFTEQTKDFCKANMNEVSRLYVKYLNEIL